MVQESQSMEIQTEFIMSSGRAEAVLEMTVVFQENYFFAVALGSSVAVDVFKIYSYSLSYLT